MRFGRIRSAGFDARAGRLAWAERDCGGGESIFTADLPVATRSAGAAGCPARLASDLVPVRRGRAAFTLGCPRGCIGELSLRPGGWTRYSLLRGESEVRVRLRPAARRRLAQLGSIEIVARLVTFNRAGDRSARSRAVTLVTH